MSLSEKIRTGNHAAPWVVDEIKQLEHEFAKLEKFLEQKIIHLRTLLDAEVHLRQATEKALGDTAAGSSSGRTARGGSCGAARTTPTRGARSHPTRRPLFRRRFRRMRRAQFRLIKHVRFQHMKHIQFRSRRVPKETTHEQRTDDSLGRGVGRAERR